jgi:type II secretory pathway pseudopilin PulG
MIIMAKRAYTLVEVLIILVLLGVIAMMVVPRFLGSSDIAKRKAIMESTIGGLSGTIQKAWESGTIPTAQAGGTAHETNLYVRRNLLFASTCQVSLGNCLAGTTPTCFCGTGLSGPSPTTVFRLQNTATVAVGNVSSSGQSGPAYANEFATYFIDWNGVKPPNTLGDDILQVSFCTTASCIHNPSGKQAGKRSEAGDIVVDLDPAPNAANLALFHKINE